MEQVLVSALVQEHLDMEVDKAQEGVDAKLNELNKPQKQMIVLALTVTGDTVRIQDAMGEKVCELSGGFVIPFVNGWLLTLVMLSLIPLLVIVGGIKSVTIAKMASHGQYAYAKASIVVE
ncbi:ABC transporter B family member 21-like protein [Tanacetum coccineum]